MASRYQEMVREFHKVMGCEYGWKTKQLRINLIQEEANEVVQAAQAGDPIDLIDGLCDLLYVVYGTADIFGLVVNAIGAETAVASKPPVGLDEIKKEMSGFVDSVGAVVTSIEAEDPHLLTYHMHLLVRGCWLMATEGLGIELAPFFEEVHRTNMLKLEGPVREDGKRLKPPGWKPPRIADMYAKRKGMPVPEDTP